ncbi:hypothetical protein AVEN_109889-1 [Araneus ventricosus]|uniref:RNase H type-1 domain-containing protein n=1 Tax=Araneus ventricosus TaxID=182803 RepID=A0A4Y2N0R1_ARAVE|nr:hypothetical protein AVEN_109889-1 [Araneus ventricosus]
MTSSPHAEQCLDGTVPSVHPKPAHKFSRKKSSALVFKSTAPVRAIGIKGNEIADTLAKEATTDGIPASLPFPKSFLTKQLLQLSLSRWQAEWDNGETGRSVYSIILKISNKQLHWSRECIQFATGHGPFPSYLKRFVLHSTDYCGRGEIGNPLHYAMRCPLTSSYHHKEPSPQFIVHWWKSALSRKLSRRNIDNLITFLATNEDLLKRQNTTPSHTPA